MVRKYYLEIGELEQNELDMSLFEYGMEEYVWWENQNQCLVTDNPKVVTDFLELKKKKKNQFNSYLKKFNLIEISADGKSTVSKTFHGRTTARYYCFKLAEVIAFLED